MRSIEEKRIHQLKKNRMTLVEDSEELRRLFPSHAIVSPGKDVIKFVPLLPRHMTKDNWRNLFWLDVKKLVLNGEVFGDLCAACGKAFYCMGHGKGMSPQFDCTADSKTIFVKLTTRKRGEDPCPR